MKNYLFILFACGLFMACQSENATQNNTETLAVDTNFTPTTKQECYEYIKNGDTAKLSLLANGNIVSGQLNYFLKEKDSNKGRIKGEMHGDTLLAQYTFNSEGIESVRQVAFIKKGNQLLEGFGEVEEKDGKMVFKYPTKLRYEQSLVYNKVDCL